MLKRTILGLSIALSAAACDRPKPASPPAQHIAGDEPTTQIVYLPTQTVMLRGKPFVLEVARTVDEQQTGLMYRTQMPADHGMIFVFPMPQQLSFWMKNTRLPLDIAYLDADGIVLNVEKMYPLDLGGIPSAGDAKYAVELNQAPPIESAFVAAIGWICQPH